MALTRFLRSARLHSTLFYSPLLHLQSIQPCDQLQFQFFSTSGRRKKMSKGKEPESDKASLSRKDAALQQALDQIEASFGKGSIMWLSQTHHFRDVPVISTGSFALDLALGIGGLPKGRVVEIYGPEASGKTTLALHVIAEAQRNGGYCAFIDAEHALDPAFAEAIGVKTENMLLSQPDCGEHALSLVDILVRSGSVDVVVVDSVAALVPKSELDGEVGDAHIALQARLMSQALRKLSHSLSCSQTILVFVNQVRAKLSTFGGFGAPSEVTCGGNALKFYASVRLNTRRVGFIKKGEEVVGTEIQVKVVKNKHAPPFKTVQLELEFGKGISRDSEVIDLGCKHKLIKKAGSSYYAIGDRNFHGKDAIKQYFHENESVREELMIKIREKMLHKELPGNNLESDLSDGRESEEEVVTEVEA
ncbi:hypothetical protein LUZ61_007404 [Rhynchospora tenuis]|uniref:Uncharacterized protein n=1 Tax=Rhynchospora tenuis TaxID=198213 RepID=A0AAD5ZTC0_9POAL|nr:hypothetical protein LUZ61_007404 [Rhynchospora tenuis]